MLTFGLMTHCLHDNAQSMDIVCKLYHFPFSIAPDTVGVQRPVLNPTLVMISFAQHNDNVCRNANALC